jgi:hypothetical protein
MNFILKASLWQPGLQISGPGKIEDATATMKVKGMMSECCNKEIQQLVTGMGVRNHHRSDLWVRTNFGCSSDLRRM